jgi:hypothetical protein
MIGGAIHARLGDSKNGFKGSENMKTARDNQELLEKSAKAQVRIENENLV